MGGREVGGRAATGVGCVGEEMRGREKRGGKEGDERVKRRRGRSQGRKEKEKLTAKCLLSHFCSTCMFPPSLPPRLTSCPLPSLPPPSLSPPPSPPPLLPDVPNLAKLALMIH